MIMKNMIYLWANLEVGEYQVLMTTPPLKMH